MATGVQGSLHTIDQMSRSEVEQVQLYRLRRQLAFVKAGNGFYRDRLRKVDPERLGSVQEFRELVPLVEKVDLLEDQEASPPYGRRLGVPRQDVVLHYMTSGTSGVGQEVYGHTIRDLTTSATRALPYPLYASGVRPGDRFYNALPVTNLAAGLIVDEMIKVGGLVGFHVFQLPSEEKITLMRRFPPAAILATPSHVARLMTVSSDLGVRPTEAMQDMKNVWVAGQAYPVSLAEQMEEYWGAKVHETYGSSQGLGFIAGTCERGVIQDGSRGRLHVYDGSVLLEVIDPDTGEHVEAGQVGMGILTNLDAEGSPVVRFRTDDRVRFLGYDCPCGRRTATLEAGTLARYDDMLKIRGMNVWPQAVDEVIFGSPAVDEYVAEVWMDDDGHEQVEVAIGYRPDADVLPGSDRDARIRQELASELRQRTNVKMSVVAKQRDELPVFEFKALRWNDRRQGDLEQKVW